MSHNQISFFFFDSFHFPCTLHVILDIKKKGVYPVPLHTLAPWPTKQTTTHTLPRFHFPVLTSSHHSINIKNKEMESRQETDQSNHSTASSSRLVPSSSSTSPSATPENAQSSIAHLFAITPHDQHLIQEWAWSTKEFDTPTRSF